MSKFAAIHKLIDDEASPEEVRGAIIKLLVTYLEQINSSMDEWQQVWLEGAIDLLRVNRNTKNYQWLYACLADIDGAMIAPEDRNDSSVKNRPLKFGDYQGLIGELRSLAGVCF